MIRSRRSQGEEIHRSGVQKTNSSELQTPAMPLWKVVVATPARAVRSDHLPERREGLNHLAEASASQEILLLRPGFQPGPETDADHRCDIRGNYDEIERGKPKHHAIGPLSGIDEQGTAK